MGSKKCVMLVSTWHLRTPCPPPLFQEEARTTRVPPHSRSPPSTTRTQPQPQQMCVVGECKHACMRHHHRRLHHYTTCQVRAHMCTQRASPPPCRHNNVRPPPPAKHHSLLLVDLGLALNPRCTKHSVNCRMSRTASTRNSRYHHQLLYTTL